MDPRPSALEASTLPTCTVGSIMYRNNLQIGHFLLSYCHIPPLYSQYVRIEVATGRADIPYENLGQLGVQVYGGCPPESRSTTPSSTTSSSSSRSWPTWRRSPFSNYLTYVRTLDQLYSTAEYVQMLHVLEECNAFLASEVDIIFFAHFSNHVETLRYVGPLSPSHPQWIQDSSSQLLEVEISADTVAASLVGGHTHHLHLSTEEDPAQ